MTINTEIEHRGIKYKVTYNDGLPENASDRTNWDGVHCYCFYKDQLVIVGYEDENYWTPPGGQIEANETFEEAAIREVKEEANMRVVYLECMGYQDVEVPDKNKILRQFRMFCVVEPYGDFESDPDGDILNMKLINPRDYREYIKWGVVGDHLMKKALEMKEIWEKNVSRL